MEKWNDHRLSWNSSAFGDVTEIQIYFEKVWRPDIGLYNESVLFHVKVN